MHRKRGGLEYMCRCRQIVLNIYRRGEEYRTRCPPGRTCCRLALLDMTSLIPSSLPIFSPSFSTPDPSHGRWADGQSPHLGIGTVIILAYCTTTLPTSVNTAPRYSDGCSREPQTTVLLACSSSGSSLNPQSPVPSTPRHPPRGNPLLLPPQTSLPDFPFWQPAHPSHCPPSIHVPPSAGTPLMVPHPTIWIFLHSIVCAAQH